MVSKGDTSFCGISRSNTTNASRKPRREPTYRNIKTSRHHKATSTPEHQNTTNTNPPKTRSHKNTKHRTIQTLNLESPSQKITVLQSTSYVSICIKNITCEEQNASSGSRQVSISSALPSATSVHINLSASPWAHLTMPSSSLKSNSSTFRLASFSRFVIFRCVKTRSVNPARNNEKPHD